MAWSVESLPSIPAARVLFSAGSLCASFVSILFCVVSDILLSTDAGRLALMYLSSVLVHSLCSSYRHLTHGHLVVSPTLGKGKYLMKNEGNKERERERKNTIFEKRCCYPSPWRGWLSPCLPTWRPGFDPRQGQKILISILGQGVRPLCSVLCCL